MSEALFQALPSAIALTVILAIFAALRWIAARVDETTRIVEPETHDRDRRSKEGG